MAKAFERTLLNQLLACTTADTESVYALLQRGVLFYQSYHLLRVPNSSISQKVYMRDSALIWSTKPKNIG